MAVPTTPTNATAANTSSTRRAGPLAGPRVVVCGLRRDRFERRDDLLTARSTVEWSAAGARGRPVQLPRGELSKADVELAGLPEVTNHELQVVGGLEHCAGRWTVRLAEKGWGDTSLTLPDGTWKDRLTGTSHRGAVPATDLFADLPVALLVRADA